MSWRRKNFDKDLLACLASANLYLLNVWRTLISPARHYQLMVVPGPLDFGVAMANILGIALLMYGILGIARRWMGERATSSVVLIYLSLLFTLVIKAYDLDDFWPNRIKALMVTIIASGLLVIWKSPGTMPKLFRAIGLLLLPCLAVTALDSAEAVLMRPVESGSALSAPFDKGHHSANPARSAWIIFDMLDYDLLFDHRAPDVPVPEFERLRRESLFARNAASPALFTKEAIPAMTTGKLVTDALPISADDLLLTIEGSPQKLHWKFLPTIFSEARDFGMSVGMVGWYHPYCRLFNAMLSSCEWTPIPEKLKDRDITAWGIERAMAEVITEDLVGPGPNIVQSVLKKEERGRGKYIDSYQHLLGAAKKALTNPALDLVVVHLSVPHTPPIFDRYSQRFSTEKGDYLDNLVLADRTLGILRHDMENAGLWESTNILVTADHGFRSTGPSDWNHRPTPLHVPFFLKMNGFQEHIEDDHPFNTIVVHDLLLALLKREVVTPGEARELLDQQDRFVCCSARTTYNPDEKKGSGRRDTPE